MRIRVVSTMAVRALAVGALSALAVVVPSQLHDPDPHPVAALTRPAGDSCGVAVLRAWDRRRARAWAAGDVAALRRLYAGGASAGPADVRLLRRYLARGLVVTGMRRQVFAVRVVRCGHRVVTMRVTDRLVGASAVSVSGRTPLPASAPRTRQLVLRAEAGAEAGRWSMASVRPASRL